MTDWEILRYVYKIGHPIKGVVVEVKEGLLSCGITWCRLHIKTSSGYPAILPYGHLTDDPNPFSPSLIPLLGQEIEAVVFNFVNGTLYLNAKPSAVTPQSIQTWRDFYNYLDTVEFGSLIQGKVLYAPHFGLFVDFGAPYVGLIDIGHSKINGGDKLPYNPSDWPKVGDEILCRIAYPRLHDRQIGLGWIKDV